MTPATARKVALITGVTGQDGAYPAELLLDTGYGDEVGTVVRVDSGECSCKPGDVIVRVDPRYYRPTEVETLLGDASKAKVKLGWTPKITLPELFSEMVKADYAAAQRDNMVKKAGFQAYDYKE